MIIWIASYPKSGNTFIRSFISAYYYTNNGEFDFNLLKFIEQFPDKQFFDGFINDKDDASKKWLPIQRKLIKSKKVKFLKTHSAYGSYNNNQFHFQLNHQIEESLFLLSGLRENYQCFLHQKI